MDLFEPQLTLFQEPDGQFTLLAVTLTPSTCFSPGLAAPGAPPEILLAPEVQPVVLRVRMRGGPCAQVLTPVRHRIRDLRLGDAHGKTSLRAFVMLNDALLGSASVRVDDPDACINCQSTPVQTADWYAWLDRMPPGPPAFHVTGTVLAPHPGYTARLARAVPQGINPNELILQLHLDEQPGSWPEVVTSIHVRFDEFPAAMAYTGVLIRIPGTGGVHLSVDVVT
jgi:hypothetical protein